MVELKEFKHGLLITLTDKEELEDKLNEDRIFSAVDMLDSARYLGNGWDELAPEQIGALTNAPIIGHNINWGDNGIELNEDSLIYWYPNYMIEDPFRVLLEKGEVFFNLAE